ncbi:MAG: hypothetical protein LBT05_00660, partial [Planctomycetaceae bacterium]|nr:hypothetical protein [Planctomycetaceae bacterium]
EGQVDHEFLREQKKGAVVKEQYKPFHVLEKDQFIAGSSIESGQNFLAPPLSHHKRSTPV